MSFYDDVIKLDPRFNLSTRCSDMMMLEPVTRAAVAGIIADVQSQFGITMMVFETFRSQARQQLLFAQKATQLQKVGVHGFGLAADLVKVINGEPSWKGDFTFLAGLAKAHGLISGVDWGQPEVKHSFIDSDHVQRCAVADQNKLFAGTFYPDDSYDPYATTA